MEATVDQATDHQCIRMAKAGSVVRWQHSEDWVMGSVSEELLVSGVDAGLEVRADDSHRLEVPAQNGNARGEVKFDRADRLGPPASAQGPFAGRAQVVDPGADAVARHKPPLTVDGDDVDRGGTRLAGLAPDDGEDVTFAPPEAQSCQG